MKTPRKQTILHWIVFLFAVAFLIVAITLFVRIRTMQEDFDQEKASKDESYAALEASISEIKREQKAMERKAYAAELLVLAQNAYFEENMRDFQGYMASLEGYADALSADALEIYEELENALRGNYND